MRHFLQIEDFLAYADGCWPDGIMCDMDGNVYAGCGDGIEVWNPSDDFIGRMIIA